jgi:hypothetical protein
MLLLVPSSFILASGYSLCVFLECLLASPIYQFVINLVVRLPLRIGQSVLMNVSVREHRALNGLIFDVAKFTILAPLSLLS